MSKDSIKSVAVDIGKAVAGALISEIILIIFTHGVGEITILIHTLTPPVAALHSNEDSTIIMLPIDTATICDPMSFTALWHQLVQGLVMSIGMGGGLTVFYTTIGTIIRIVKKRVVDSPSDFTKKVVAKMFAAK